MILFSEKLNVGNKISCGPNFTRNYSDISFLGNKLNVVNKIFCASRSSSPLGPSKL